MDYNPGRSSRIDNSLCIGMHVRHPARLSGSIGSPQAGTLGAMKSWTVAGALLEGTDGLLLVLNQRRGGIIDWSTPGGVIDEGESVIEGLTREVFEETGLTVTRWQGPVYVVSASAPGLGWTLRVEAHRALAYEGELRLDDPDGIVVEASFHDLPACLERLSSARRWVREPLSEWLAERWHDGRSFDYHIDGTDIRSLEITRL